MNTAQLHSLQIRRENCLQIYMLKGGRAAWDALVEATGDLLTAYKRAI